MKKGKLLVFTAPSGAGKTTLVKHLLEHLSNLKFSVSATTRLKRESEIDGKDYHFLSKDVFAEKVAKGDFLEYEQVYNNIYYGTLKHTTNELLERGINVIFDIDVKGAKSIKKCYGKRALTIFVAPPSIEVLQKRLNKRNTETDDMLQQRLQRADMEMERAFSFDARIVNDDLEVAKKQVMDLVCNFLEKAGEMPKPYECCKK